MFRILDGRASFWQWDLGQKLVVENVDCCEVHFCNRTGDCSLVCEVYEKDGQRIVDVPNLLLQTAATIRVYAYSKNNDGSSTLHEMRFNVLQRTKPADYVYTETEMYTVEAVIDEAIKPIKNDLESVKTDMKNVSELTDDNNADIAELYNRVEALEENGAGGGDSHVKYIYGTKENATIIRSLESGTYLLEGYFILNDGKSGAFMMNPVRHVVIDRYDDRTELQCFNPTDNKFVYYNITDTNFHYDIIKMSEMEKITNRVTAINATADDEHYPTARAVYDFVEQNGGSFVSHCWQGKKIVFLGDSIAQGYTDKGNVTTPYPKVVANNLGMDLTNYGIGGSTVAQQENYGGAFATQADFEAAEKDTSKIYQVITGQGKKTFEYDNDTSTWINSSVNVRTPLSARWSFMRDDADLIVVQSGTNDFQYDWTPVGTMADRTPHTFYGALHTLFAGLLEKYKGKTIVFLTSLKRAQTPYTNPESQNSYGLTLGDYRDIMIEVCDYYGVPVIDVFSVSGLNPYLESQADIFDNAKTHPLQWGHNRLGDIVSTRLLSVQQFMSAEYVPPVAPITATWYENKALSSGSTELKDMNYRTTCDYVAIPESGLTITLTDDDLEMCIYTYTKSNKQSAIMGSYLTERTYSVGYADPSQMYVRIMVRSKSNPNGTLITAERAAAGVKLSKS